MAKTGCQDQECAACGEGLDWWGSAIHCAGPPGMDGFRVMEWKQFGSSLSSVSWFSNDSHPLPGASLSIYYREDCRDCVFLSLLAG